MRRSVGRALDGLDRRCAPAWWEDVDFCARLQRRLGTPGFPASEGFWVIPESRVRHLGGTSAGRLARVDFLIPYFGNLLRYAERHHGSRLVLIRSALRLSLLARAALRPGDRSAYREIAGRVAGGWPRRV